MSSVQRNPVVGVLVTHNSQQFLAELLDSIDSQTQPLDQLIVIDDNSTDSTRSILSERGITAIPQPVRQLTFQLGLPVISSKAFGAPHQNPL